MNRSRAALTAVFAMSSLNALAADYPAPRQGDWTVGDFKFHSGQTMPELRLHYTTVGEPSGQPVLVLHGSGGSAASMLTPTFAGELFGPGQPLDAAKYYIIIPDSIGHGKSSKPSDGMKTAFPKYDYDDMVDAQYRLVKEGLGVKHLPLVIGNSMGGMHTWTWGVKYPHFMDALVPMAAQPTEMAARNWMLRRMMIETIRNDPDYNGGNYTAQPRMMKYAIAAYRFASAGGTLGYQTLAPTAAKADQMVDELLASPVTADANDFIYQWDASHDYNPSPGLERIEATLLAINAADDERNPPETGVTDAAMKRVKNRDARASHDRQCRVLQRAAAGIAAKRAEAHDVRPARSQSESDMSSKRFRHVAMSLPGVIEGSHQGHADFRVGTRIFATLAYPDHHWGMVKLTPEQQSVLVEAEPGIFRPVPGGWGKRGSTNVRLATADQATLQSALKLAWSNIAPKSLLKAHAI
jgi:homoserine O-acetyltransferase/O-succinyltransferase